VLDRMKSIGHDGRRARSNPRQTPRLRGLVVVGVPSPRQPQERHTRWSSRAQKRGRRLASGGSAPGRLPEPSPDRSAIVVCTDKTRMSQRTAASLVGSPQSFTASVARHHADVDTRER
jgi:hypothetical protein